MELELELGLGQAFGGDRYRESIFKGHGRKNKGAFNSKVS